MGLWGVLLELAKAVVPHAAPHVARAVSNAARERRAALKADHAPTPQAPSNESLASAITYLEQRLTVAEERAAAAEEQFAQAEARMSERWIEAGKIVRGLIVWNVVVTAALISILIYLLVRQ